MNKETNSYRIRISGHIDDIWIDWFKGMSILRENDGTTTLYGPVSDQATLYGILNGIRDLGLYLISVQFVENE